jgi:hypothetical protein
LQQHEEITGRWWHSLCLGSVLGRKPTSSSFQAS